MALMKAFAVVEQWEDDPPMASVITLDRNLAVRLMQEVALIRGSGIYSPSDDPAYEISAETDNGIKVLFRVEEIQVEDWLFYLYR